MLNKFEQLEVYSELYVEEGGLFLYPTLAFVVYKIVTDERSNEVLWHVHCFNGKSQVFNTKDSAITWGEENARP